MKVASSNLPGMNGLRTIRTKITVNLYCFLGSMYIDTDKEIKIVGNIMKTETTLVTMTLIAFSHSLERNQFDVCFRLGVSDHRNSLIWKYRYWMIFVLTSFIFYFCSYFSTLQYRQSVGYKRS